MLEEKQVYCQMNAVPKPWVHVSVFLLTLQWFLGY